MIACQLGDYLERLLTEHNYEVIRYGTPDYSNDAEHTRALVEAGAFIAVISNSFVRSLYCRSELGHALHSYNRSPDTFSNKIIPIYFDVNPTLLLSSGAIQSPIRLFRGLDIPRRETLTDGEAQTLLQLLRQEAPVQSDAP